ncbi:MAG: hypothetical protein V8R91_20245 [Butyricimonas faecihominis]
MVARLRLDLPRKSVQYTGISKITPNATYLPIFTGVTRIPEVYSTYNPKEYSDNSARWAIDFVDNLLHLNWQDGKKDLEAARAPMEQSFFERNAEIEKEFIALQKKNPKKATELLNKYTQECADTIMQTYVQLRNTLGSQSTRTIK